MPMNIYELLRRKKLHPPRNPLRELSKLSLVGLKELLEEIDEAIRQSDLITVGTADNGPFNFTASPYAVGFSGPCIRWECKLARADEFLRYAILYADAVALPNEFSYYARADRFTPAQLELLRNQLSGDILVLWRIKPLIDAGIAAFVPNAIGLCDEHGRQLEATWDLVESKLIRAAKSLQRKMTPDTRVKLVANKEGIKYDVSLPSQFFETNYRTVESVQPPDWLTRTRNYKTAYRSGNLVELSTKQIERFGVVEKELLDILTKARGYLFSRMFMSSKFLTSRPADALLLDQALADESLRQVSRNIKENIPLKMPIIQGVDARTLLKIRHQDYDAFLNYRSAIVEIENEYQKKRKNLSRADAVGLYEDVIYPNLRRLEAKANIIKRELRSSAAKRVVIAATIATTGIVLGLLPHDAARVLEIVGACEMIRPVADLWKSTGIPDEVKSDPFYFLWNVERYNKHATRH